MRRLKALAVCPEILMAMLTPGERRYVVESDIPDDVRVQSIYHDGARQAVVLILEHESFPPLLPTDRVPFMASPSIRDYEAEPGLDA